MNAPITITLAPEQASLLRDLLEARRQDIAEPSQFTDPDPDVVLIQELQRLLSWPAAPRPSSRLTRLWAVFAPSASSTLSDVLWGCTAQTLLQANQYPSAIFTDEAEALAFAHDLLLVRASELKNMAADLEGRR